MENEENKNPHLLGNELLGDDLFEGGSQKSIAKSIIDILKNNTCKMIGIDGGWGTGKSNLVKIVENLINNNGNKIKEEKKKYHFFIYDAWGHQEDEQRRSILEELTDYLINKNVCNFNHNKWLEKRKQLLSKKKTTTIRTKPKIGWGYFLSIVVVIFTPVLKVISDTLPEKENCLKLLIVSIPFIVFLLIYLYKVLLEGINHCNEKKNYTGNWFKNAGYELFYITKQESREKENFEVITEEQPTVRDFRSWIKEIDNDLINGNKLIIVFDNMDRLPKIKIQELWSSIHTFFAEDNDFKNISVIVPFDREHIKTAFKEEDSKNNCFGNDFINKTFNVVFRVSLPIMTDWKKFFKQKWEEAFGNVEYINDIIQIYEALTERITPREIIAFINEFVTIKISNDQNIEDKYIALFIKGKDIILNDPIKEIIDPSYLGESLSKIYNNGEDMQNNIAAIIYQIKVENALSIVYTDLLKKALNEKDFEKVNLISKSPKFYDILFSIVCQISNIINAIEALKEISKDFYEGEENYNKIWKDIYFQAIKVVETNSEIQEYQKIVLRNVIPTFKEKWIKHIIKKYTEELYLNSSVYCNNLKEIDEIIIREKYKINLSKLINNKTTYAQDFVDYLINEDSDFEKYKLLCDEKELDSFLVEQPIKIIGNYNFMPKLLKKYKLDKYIEYIKSFVGNSTIQSNLEHLKIAIKRNKEIERPITTKIPDNIIYSHFNSTKNTDDFFYDLLAMQIAKLNTFNNSSFMTPFLSHLNSEDEITIKKVAERIEYYADFGSLLLNLSNYGQYLLYVGIAKKLILESQGKSRANINFLLKEFITIRVSCDVSSKQLISRLDGWSEYYEENISNIEDAIPYKLLEETKDEDFEIVSKYKNNVIEYLNNLTIEDWSNAFEDIESYKVKAALLLDYKWNSNSTSGLNEVLKKIAIGELIIPNKEKWKDLISNLERHKKGLKTIFKNIRDVLCESADSISKEMFLFFGEWLFEYSNLKDKNDSLRKIFPSNIIKNDDILEVIIKYKEKMPEIISNADSDDYNGFKEALKEFAQEEKEKAIELAKYLNIDFEIIEEENKDEEDASA